MFREKNNEKKKVLETRNFIQWKSIKTENDRLKAFVQMDCRIGTEYVL